MAKGDHSLKAKAERIADRRAAEATLDAAVAYAKGHNIGAKKTLKTKLFSGVGVMQLHNALHERIKRVRGERHAQDVLTDVEETQLAQWIIDSGRGKNPASDGAGVAGSGALLRPKRLTALASSTVICLLRLCFHQHQNSLSRRRLLCPMGCAPVRSPQLRCRLQSCREGLLH